jgi:hypothetical protein
MDLKIKTSLRANDQGTLFDPENGDSFTLNPTGLLILRKLQSGLTEERIYLDISTEYEISREDFNRLLLDFGSLLKSFQLLEDGY